jgi:hypothetical protein
MGLFLILPQACPFEGKYKKGHLHKINYRPFFDIVKSDGNHEGSAAPKGGDGAC